MTVLSSMLKVLTSVALWTTTYADDRSATIGYGGMVGSAHYLATQAGLKILENGGNAADAAVAVQFALNVVQPDGSGIGGGCFMVYYDYESKEVYAIDGREEAPDDFHGKVFCQNPDCQTDEDCDDCTTNDDTIWANMDYDDIRVGGMGAGVPGTLYALWNLYTYFGTGYDWSELLEEARRLADEGFPMYEEMYVDLDEDYRSIIPTFNVTEALYYNDDGSVKVEIGETFTNPDFATLLAEFQDLGPNGTLEEFYTGDLAQAIVDATRTYPSRWTYNNNGSTFDRPGMIEMDDMANYRAVFRDPAQSVLGGDDDWEGNDWKMYGMNMPSSGPMTVQYLMNLMYSLFDSDDADLSDASDILDGDMSDANNVHYLITAENIAFADRNQYMADMDFVDVPVEGLVDFDYISVDRAAFFDNEAVDTPIPYGEPPESTDASVKNQRSLEGPEYGTSHFFVVDQWNNVATITTTIEGHWGSTIVVPGKGFLLNNELLDFAGLNEIDNETIANGPEGGNQMRSSALDIFGLSDSTTEGGKRPRSSMAPSFVTDEETGGPVLSVGSPGGASIIMTTFQVMFSVLMRGWDVQDAIDGGRINSFNGDWVQVDPKIWAENPDLLDQLDALGYDTSIFYNGSQGNCQAVKFELIAEEDHCQGFDDFYVLYGGADDTRHPTASVQALCSGDGTDYDGNVTICLDRMNSCEPKDWGVGGLVVGLVVVALILIGFIVYVVMMCAKKKDGDARSGGSANVEAGGTATQAGATEDAGL